MPQDSQAAAMTAAQRAMKAEIVAPAVAEAVEGSGNVGGTDKKHEIEAQGRAGEGGIEEPERDRDGEEDADRLEQGGEHVGCGRAQAPEIEKVPDAAAFRRVEGDSQP
jgi:hypothetical protein